MIKYIFYLLRLAMKYYSINFIKAEGGWLYRCLLLFQAKSTKWILMKLFSNISHMSE